MNFLKDNESTTNVKEKARPLGELGNIPEIGLNIFSSLVFLFFIQQITFLVESIYTLNLLHTSMDEKVLGLLLLATPVLLYFIESNKFNYIIIITAMLVCLVLSPLLSTSYRIFSSGLGAGLFLLYLGLQFSDNKMPTANWGLAAGLATLASIALRVIGQTQDISVSGDTKFLSWAFVLIAGTLFYRIVKGYNESEDLHLQHENKNKDHGYLPDLLGLIGSVLLIYFAFSSPGVIARWTGGNYIIIHLVLCISILVVVFFGAARIIQFSEYKLFLAIWNAIFLSLLILSIHLHRVDFPTSSAMDPVVVGEESIFSLMVTYMMLILSPVVFINISLFAQKIKATNPAKLANPFFLGIILIITSIFILIFSNVWGYSGSVSRIFRNQFHLSFVLVGIFILLPYFFGSNKKQDFETDSWTPIWGKVLSLLLVALICFAVISGQQNQIETKPEVARELTLMTYNIQQGVDFFGNKNFKGQLEMIVGINPDILCLQESDASRISGGNSDVVRYFADNLGFYTYYGPKTVTGTFGTAILSRFPLHSCRTIFTYSDKDEIGTAVAVISVGDRDITLINSHPAGGKKAKHEHIDMVAALAKEKNMVIAMGDYNFRQDSPYYQKITSILSDAWLTLYPDAIGPVDGGKLDMSFENRNRSSGLLLQGGKLDMKGRIDHIFLSKDFTVLEAHYLPAPESETDHPAHWAVVRWD